MASLKEKVLSGFFWKFLEHVGSYGIQFLGSVLLARLLAPEQFGVLAIVEVFIAFAYILVDSGFVTALIQKKELDDLDCDTAFVVNIAASVICYGVLYFSAPLIGRCYEHDELASVIRVLSLTVIVGGMGNVQSALLERRMLFKLNFRITWISQLTGGAVGVWMAYRGYGVWALVAQEMCRRVIRVVMLWWLVRWMPRVKFDFARARVLFGFGSKCLGASLLESLSSNAFGAVAGKLYSLEQYSFYQRGFRLPELGANLINYAASSVLFPAFSSLQDDKEQMRELMRRGLRNIMFLVIPMLGMLYVTSDTLVEILYTDKWLPCVPYMKLTCLMYFFAPLHTFNLRMILALGRSDRHLLLEVIKKVLFAVMLLVTYRFSLMAMAWGMVAFAVVSFFVNSSMSDVLIGYSCFRQIADLLPMTGIAIVSAVCCYGAMIFVSALLGKLLIGVVVFGIVFLGLSCVFKAIPEDCVKLMKRVKMP